VAFFLPFFPSFGTIIMFYLFIYDSQDDMYGFMGFDIKGLQQCRCKKKTLSFFFFFLFSFFFFLCFLCFLCFLFSFFSFLFLFPLSLPFPFSLFSLSFLFFRGGQAQLPENWFFMGSSFPVSLTLFTLLCEFFCCVFVCCMSCIWLALITMDFAFCFLLPRVPAVSLIF